MNLVFSPRIEYTLVLSPKHIVLHSVMVNYKLLFNYKGDQSHAGTSWITYLFVDKCYPLSLWLEATTLEKSQRGYLWLEVTTVHSNQRSQHLKSHKIFDYVQLDKWPCSHRDFNKYLLKQPKTATICCGHIPQHLKSLREAICGQKTSKCCFIQNHKIW